MLDFSFAGPPSFQLQSHGRPACTQKP